MHHKLIILQKTDAVHGIPPFQYDLWVDAVYLGHFPGDVLNGLKKPNAPVSFLTTKQWEKEMRKRGIQMSFRGFLSLLQEYPDFPADEARP
jgi:hypothetical protein